MAHRLMYRVEMGHSHAISGALVVVVLGAFCTQAATAVPRGDVVNADRVRELCRDGSFVPVAVLAPQLIAQAKREGRNAEAAEFLLSLADAQHVLGRIAEAGVTLREAAERSRASGDRLLECRAQAAFGAHLGLTRHWSEAEAVLKESASIAEELGKDAPDETIITRKTKGFVSRLALTFSGTADLASKGGMIGEFGERLAAWLVALSVWTEWHAAHHVPPDPCK